METYMLDARFDSRASFYNKAKVVITDDGNKELYSYSTKVAAIIDGNPIIYGTYSATTTRHIKEFLLQNDFRANDTKQMVRDYSIDDFEIVLQKFLKSVDKCKLLKVDTEGDLKDMGSIDEVNILDNHNRVLLRFIRDHLSFTVYFDNGKNVTINTGYTLRDTLLHIVDIINETNEDLGDELFECVP